MILLFKFPFKEKEISKEVNVLSFLIEEDDPTLVKMYKHIIELHFTLLKMLRSFAFLTEKRR